MLIDLATNPGPEVIPYDSDPPKLFVAATAKDGTRYVYKRPFAASDRVHAEYFRRVVMAAGHIEAEHWSEAK